MHKTVRLSLAVAMLGALIASGSAAAPAIDRAAAARAEHERIVEFWTPARVAQAIPRDFEFDPSTGHFRPAAPPPGRGPKPPEPPVTLAQAWPQGQGTVQHTTGKVLFQMGRSYYVCSASVVTDAATDRSLVLTAAHCVFDESGHDRKRTPGDERFADNWMFIPDYDSAAVPLDTQGSFCAATTYGCWTAESLVVHDGYASAGGFNAQATLYDFAFAVVGAGGHDGTLAEATVGTQGIRYSSVAVGDAVYAFGYPAASPFDGTELWYCNGAVGLDPDNSDLTYRLPCDMTGGSSGGPWFSGFSYSTGTGTMISVNSYGYSGIDAMHGPMFGADTRAVFAAAETAVGDTIVSP